MQHDKSWLQAYVESLPADVQSNPQQVGSLLYSCVTLAQEEERMLHQAIPQSPFQVSSETRTQRQDSKHGSTVYCCCVLARVQFCIACVSVCLQIHMQDTLCISDLYQL